MKTEIKTIVAFHIGRGGSFNNGGHKSFIGEREISDFVGDLFSSFENQSKFKDRFGFDATHGSDQRCILDLITDCDFDELEEKFGIKKEELGEEIYFDGAGNSTGLTQKACDSGIGKINIDNEYDTTYTCYLEDCDETEIQAMRDYQGYKGSNVELFLEELDVKTLNELSEGDKFYFEDRPNTIYQYVGDNRNDGEYVLPSDMNNVLIADGNLKVYIVY